MFSSQTPLTRGIAASLFVLGMVISTQSGICAQTTATTTMRRIENLQTTANMRILQDNHGSSTTQPRHVRPEELPIATSRPILAVGKLLAIDTATSSLTLQIDREHCGLPSRFVTTAKRLDRFDELMDQEFPPLRSYQLSPITMYVNATGTEPRRQVAATTGQVPNDKQILTPSSFHPGDWVGVLYRMVPDPSTPPVVLNLSRLDPARTNYMLDFNPLGGPVVRNTTSPLTVMIPDAEGTQTQDSMNP